MVIKKIPYSARKDTEWDAAATKAFRLRIANKRKAISEKYRKWWDHEKHEWKKNFPGHGLDKY